MNGSAKSPLCQSSKANLKPALPQKPSRAKISERWPLLGPQYANRLFQLLLLTATGMEALGGQVCCLSQPARQSGAHSAFSSTPAVTAFLLAQDLSVVSSLIFPAPFCPHPQHNLEWFFADKNNVILSLSVSHHSVAWTPASYHLQGPLLPTFLVSSPHYVPTT